jgi:16S rRNA (guanine966-N2)-methyltransferase
LSNPRIIGGIARGIRLEMVPGEITRPITDRVKEALFDIIGADIINSRFLDLFGGTGSVGIEALSRGAIFSKFLDINQTATSVIKQNLAKTKLSLNAEVVRMDAHVYLKSQKNDVFDYIFIAPPQYKKIWLDILALLDENPVQINTDGWIIVQIDPIEMEEPALNHFELFDERLYGNTTLLFFIKK